jgi:hypothetical protein
LTTETDEVDYIVGWQNIIAAFPLQHCVPNRYGDGNDFALDLMWLQSHFLCCAKFPVSEQTQCALKLLATEISESDEDLCGVRKVRRVEGWTSATTKPALRSVLPTDS